MRFALLCGTSVVIAIATPISIDIAIATSIDSIDDMIVKVLIGSIVFTSMFKIHDDYFYCYHKGSNTTLLQSPWPANGTNRGCVVSVGIACRSQLQASVPLLYYSTQNPSYATLSLL